MLQYPASLPAVPVHLRDNPTWKTLPSAPDLYWLPIRNEASQYNVAARFSYMFFKFCTF